MNWIETIILGLVQGLTEFLPVSSSAHLRIVGELLPNSADPGAAFTAITQLGTETAVIIYFWRDIVRILKQWTLSLVGRVERSDPDARMGWLIILGSLPIGVLGLLLEDYIDTEFRSLWITATMLVVFGVILAVADRVGRQARHLDDLTVKHGVLFGLAQALALIPGVSRSGGTITAGLLMGYTREAAARYAFLLAIPAVFASGLYKLAQSVGQPQAGPYGMTETLVATGIAFVVAYVIIGWFMHYISNRSYTIFVWYRIALGLAIFVLLGLGVISA
ncbi:MULTISPECIES: undecaprenyl-diphosphate phosphatase [Kocuria]|uniref:Undecaprenyl-diphosphatase n=2 Tax=Kocuria rosea TaxID=1275 RepID=A0A0A6YD39_KOCRO|nr:MULTISPECIES: undecaprenyl-diphosphate phosphatase [Kocuria]MCC5781490.1 undecaprenyl-diphosphate phosphatase [Kocuria sp. CCUG 69068]NVC25362.1 undecaprenyl-diphosphate phosphatase [Kocuria salina]EYT51447.1 UDP-diphosphatase [Kocuria sp. UCD-OTCP]KHD98517.1 UDP-diphosphatase [Kocuria polaris]MCM3485477.1 undecaprenyl-diphosphate phosphatase [Kocuria rosea]